jgi:NAD(P)H-nitrite reductase large subunit
MDGKFLLGGMMIGDTKDYLKLNQMVKLQKASLPSELEYVSNSRTNDTHRSSAFSSPPFCAPRIFLLGGMMIGDTKDYLKLNQMVKLQKELEVPPSQYCDMNRSGCCHHCRVS